MRRQRSSLVSPVFCFLLACSSSAPTMHDAVEERRFDFAGGALPGWAFGIADFSDGTQPANVVTSVQLAPSPFSGHALLLAGTNRSDDLMVYAKTRLTGLRPLQQYRVTGSVSVLTDVPSGCIGVGGAPGESVWVVMAAAAEEPATVLQGGEYRLNLPRGNQGTSGPAGIVLGNLANTVADCGPRRWERKSLSGGAEQSIVVSADREGRMWVVVGMDSGFEATSQVFIQRFDLSLTSQ